MPWIPSRILSHRLLTRLLPAEYENLRYYWYITSRPRVPMYSAANTSRAALFFRCSRKPSSFTSFPPFIIGFLLRGTEGQGSYSSRRTLLSHVHFHKKGTKRAPFLLLPLRAFAGGPPSSPCSFKGELSRSSAVKFVEERDNCSYISAVH